MRILPDSFSRFVLETLAYSDIFDYPLRLDELHQYLAISCSLKDLQTCVSGEPRVESKDGYFFLRGRASIVEIRRSRETDARKYFDRAVLYGRILGRLPFIRMVALTGSLAFRNCDATGDYDFMLIAQTGRVWLARAFALLLNRVAGLFGETLCPNLVISERAIEWTQRNLYSAREICQMVLISGKAAYLEFRAANNWSQGYFPNFSYNFGVVSNQDKFRNPFQLLIEKTLAGKPGDQLERWEMKRKIARFTKQQGYGLETVFNADICQGNFDHHGTRILKKYEERLHEINLEPAYLSFSHLKEQDGSLVE